MAAPAINRPGDNEVRGIVGVGWWEVAIPITIHIAITRRIKTTITIQITITITIPNTDNDHESACVIPKTISHITVQA